MWCENHRKTISRHETYKIKRDISRQTLAQKFGPMARNIDKSERKRKLNELFLFVIETKQNRFLIFSDENLAKK
jgi:hypothetical protein